MSDTNPRLVVTAGSPTTEEMAAAAAVLLGMAAGHRDPAQPRRVPAWGRAARFEAVGQAPFTSSVDPRLQHRTSGALPPAAN